MSQRRSRKNLNKRKKRRRKKMERRKIMTLK